MQASRRANIQGGWLRGREIGKQVSRHAYKYGGKTERVKGRQSAGRQEGRQRKMTVQG